jgi:Ras-related protein Rab-11A
MGESNEEYKMIFKVVIVGDSGVGKTNILLRYLKNEFNEESKATVGVEFGTKKMKIDNSNIKVQIWDTAGQERYRSITSAYYRGAHGALVVYDITSKKTFDSVEKWVNDLKTNGEPKMVIMVIGNKADKEEERVITKVDGEAKSQRNNVAFLETSALTAENIEQAFEEVIQKLCTTYKSDFDNDAQYEFGEGTKGNTIDIGTKSDQQKSKKCCE